MLGLGLKRRTAWHFAVGDVSMAGGLLVLTCIRTPRCMAAPRLLPFAHLSEPNLDRVALDLLIINIFTQLPQPQNLYRDDKSLNHGTRPAVVGR